MPRVNAGRKKRQWLRVGEKIKKKKDKPSISGFLEKEEERKI